MSEQYNFKQQKLEAGIPTTQDLIAALHQNAGADQGEGTPTSAEAKLSAVLTQFPPVGSLHPFYGDLVNVLFDAAHYTEALNQIRSVHREVVQWNSRIGAKCGSEKLQGEAQRESNLEGAMNALSLEQEDGKLGTGVENNDDDDEQQKANDLVASINTLQAPLVYLSQVRTHMLRLPVIDPNGRTLMLTGFPNVGKSTFMNHVTRANVDVQPYAFTTKNLFVGHMDYQHSRWQVIDTPGLLDHPLEDRNTIEMQAVTALAHLTASILFFVDLSETCGYTIQQQLNLLHSLRPLFSRKPLIVVFTKEDLVKLEDLPSEQQEVVLQAVQGHFTASATHLSVSLLSDEGVGELKKVSCEALLALRSQTKS